MKKKKILIPMSLMTLLIAGVGVSQAMAADNSTSAKLFKWGGQQKERPAELTDEQKTEMKTKMDAVKAAEASGNYNAWVVAVKDMNKNSPLLKQAASADEFKAYLEKKAEREAEMTERKTKMEAVKTALASGNYDAWAAAVKAENENSPILEKITSENFSKYVEANNLRTQADNILKELGIQGEGRGDMGLGGMTGGHGGPRDGEKPAKNSQ